MNRLLGILAVALSAVALGVTLLSGPCSSRPEPGTPKVADESQRPPSELTDAPDSDARMASLESTVTLLVHRVSALERALSSRPTAEGPAAAPAQSQQLESLRADVDALLTGEPLDTEKGRQRLKEIVRSVQDEVFADRTQARTAAREEERAARLKRFAEEAGLSSSQSQDLTSLLDNETRQRRALLEQLRSGQGDRQQGFGEMRTLRQRTDESAKRILSADQYTQYEQLRQEDHRGPGAGRGSAAPGAQPMR
jgi:hypothetical protein